MPNIDVKVLGVAESFSAILQVEDYKTGSVNELITPNRNLRIIGQKIKIAGDDISNGVFFIETATGLETKVPFEDIITNNPSELVILLPELTSGTYTLQIASQYSGSNLLKEPRTTTYERELIVD